jgi:hypothetical protein
MNSNNPFRNMDSAYQASLNNAYKAAQVRQGSNSMLPEGKYQCAISIFSLKPNANYPDELSLMLGFEVISGDQKGVTAYKFYSINPENLDTLKTDMTKLGIDLTQDITILGEAQTADAILDQIVDITVKHKKRKDKEGFYQNIYINRSIGKASDQFQEVDDDELPFE